MAEATAVSSVTSGNVCDWVFTWQYDKLKQWKHFICVVSSQGRIQDLPDGGANSKRGCQPIIWPIFPEN